MSFVWSGWFVRLPLSWFRSTLFLPDWQFVFYNSVDKTAALPDTRQPKGPCEFPVPTFTRAQTPAAMQSRSCHGNMGIVTTRMQLRENGNLKFERDSDSDNIFSPERNWGWTIELRPSKVCHLWLALLCSGLFFLIKQLRQETAGQYINREEEIHK